MSAAIISTPVWLATVCTTVLKPCAVWLAKAGMVLAKAGVTPRLGKLGKIMYLAPLLLSSAAWADNVAPAVIKLL